MSAAAAFPINFRSSLIGTSDHFLRLSRFSDRKAIKPVFMQVCCRSPLDRKVIGSGRKRPFRSSEGTTGALDRKRPVEGRPGR